MFRQDAPCNVRDRLNQNNKAHAQRGIEGEMQHDNACRRRDFESRQGVSDQWQ